MFVPNDCIRAIEQQHTMTDFVWVCGIHYSYVHQTVQMISTTFQMNHFLHIICFTENIQVEWCPMIWILYTQKPSSFSLSSLTIQHNSNRHIICYDKCRILHINAFLCVRMCVFPAISSINCSVFEMHAVLMKMKIFYTKYHANYFMTNGTIECFK